MCFALGPCRVSRPFPASSHAAWRPCPPLVCCLPLTPLAAMSFSWLLALVALTFLALPCCPAGSCALALFCFGLVCSFFAFFALRCWAVGGRCWRGGGGGLALVVRCWVVGVWWAFLLCCLWCLGVLVGLAAWGGRRPLLCGGLGFVLVVWVVGRLWVLWWVGGVAVGTSLCLRRFCIFAGLMV